MRPICTTPQVPQNPSTVSAWVSKVLLVALATTLVSWVLVSMGAPVDLRQSRKPDFAKSGSGTGSILSGALPSPATGSEASEVRVRGHGMDQLLRRGISLKWLTEAHEGRPASTLSGEGRRIPLSFDNAPLGNPLYLSAWRAIVH